MSEKRNIDKLFRQKLGDFEATPNASVWDNISQQIQQESKDRKGIPLWWKIAGVAAGIILLITVGTTLFNSEDTKNNPEQNVVDTETPVNQDLQNVEDNASGDDSQANPIEKNTAPDEQGKSSETTVAGTENPKTSNQQMRGNIERQPAQEVVVDNSVVNKSDQIKNKAGQNENSNRITAPTEGGKINAETEAAVADTNKPGENKGLNPQKPQDKSKEDIAPMNDNIPVPVKPDTRDTVLADSNEDKTTEENITEDAQETIEEAVAAQEESESDEKEEFGNRWGVTPQVAPVYFNSLGSGSAIDEEFSGNSRTGEVNMNYGIVASYDFNEKLTLRAGVNQMNLSYRTNDVIVYNNIQPDTGEKPLKNVNLNAESMDLSFISSNGLNVAQVPGVVADNIQSSIDQEIGFIEIPLELEYKLSDNKVGLSVIGGLSTLILSENKIYSSLQGERRELGEASNINSTSFSANLGLGMNVKISESIDLNLEPVFKYQLNTFKDTNGNFNPYAMGIYTGLSFKF